MMFEQDPEDQYDQEEDRQESEKKDSSSDISYLREPEPRSVPTDVAPSEAVPPAAPETGIPEGPAWYVIHCYSGYENKVRQVGS